MEYEDFVDIFGVHHKIGIVLGVFSSYFRVFFNVNVHNEDIFGDCKNFKYFWGA